MKFYIVKPGSSWQEFDTITEFLKAISDLANTYAENGEDWFEIEVVNG